MIERRGWNLVGLLCLTMSCGGGSPSDTTTDDGSGGTNNASADAFLLPRDYETNGVQMVRDANGVTHLIAAPTLVDAGHARVLYGRCAQDCGAPASWSYGTIADGFTADKIRIALAADGTVHVALLEDTQVTFGELQRALHGHIGLTFRPVTAPAEQVWQYMPKGRPFAVSAAGLPRLVVNGRSNGSTAVLLIAQSDAGFSADPLLNIFLSAVQSIATGDRIELVGALSDSGYSVGYLACTANCHDVTQYAGDVFTNSNTTLLAAARGPDGVLHVMHASSLASFPNDDLMWSRCASDCAKADSWLHTVIGDGNEARGSLDLAVRSDGTLGVAHAPPSAILHAVYLRTCPSGCATSTDWTTPAYVDRSGDVNEAAPTDTHESCSSPDRAWSVGDNAQLVPTSRAFLIGYDAALYSRCNYIKTDDHYYAIGRYVRLREQK